MVTISPILEYRLAPSGRSARISVPGRRKHDRGRSAGIMHHDGAGSLVYSFSSRFCLARMQPVKSVVGRSTLITMAVPAQPFDLTNSTNLAACERGRVHRPSNLRKLRDGSSSSLSHRPALPLFQMEAGKPAIPIEPGHRPVDPSPVTGVRPFIAPWSCMPLRVARRRSFQRPAMGLFSHQWVPHAGIPSRI